MIKAVLVGIRLKDNRHFDKAIEECLALADADEIDVVLTMCQTSDSPDPSTALRKGKLEELKNALEEYEAELVLFYNDLSASVISNLEKELGVSVMDRTNLILDIFSRHASSREAKIQIEIARLHYALPKSILESGSGEKMRGGSFNNRGSGETKNEDLKRKMEGRIASLKEELRKLEKRKESEYRKQKRSGLKKAALVGYTNAGKSSLMNALLACNNKAEKGVLAKDQLFATLDTSVRSICYGRYEFLLSDTVGFVSDLPHSLIKAFRSTLQAASDADLLIEVIDLSDPDHFLEEEVSEATLKEIGASDIPLLKVYNKADRCEERIEGEHCISCKKGWGIEELLETIVSKLYPEEISEEILIPYDKLNILSRYQNIVAFKMIEDREEGELYRVSTNKRLIDEIRDKI